MIKEPRYPLAGWPAFACERAKDAHENFFSSRRGSWIYEDLGVVVLYDNNPTNEPSIRMRVLQALAAKIETAGIKQLAKASYPMSGPNDGYTFAMVFLGSQEVHDRLVALWHEALNDR